VRSARNQVITTLAAFTALVTVAVGLWAIVDPESFYAIIAPYPPYSQHLIHDIGAFVLGLGCCLVLGLFVRDALLVVLAGNAIGGTAHFISHVIDRSLGGHANDPGAIGLVALLLTLLSVARWWAVRASQTVATHRVIQGVSK